MAYKTCLASIIKVCYNNVFEAHNIQTRKLYDFKYFKSVLFIGDIYKKNRRFFFLYIKMLEKKDIKINLAIDFVRPENIGVLLLLHR